MLANIVCWLALRLGLSINTLDMLELLHPFIDGYAMNLIWQENQNINAARYEFAGNRIIKSCLAMILAVICSRSIISQTGPIPALRVMEALSERTERAMSKRVDRTVQALRKDYRSHKWNMTSNEPLLPFDYVSGGKRMGICE